MDCIIKSALHYRSHSPIHTDFLYIVHLYHTSLSPIHTVIVQASGAIWVSGFWGFWVSPEGHFKEVMSWRSLRSNHREVEVPLFLLSRNRSQVMSGCDRLKSAKAPSSCSHRPSCSLHPTELRWPSVCQKSVTRLTSLSQN